jgi:protein-S-isoprenylcysteine O-methyltransferase Ste14
MRAVDVVFGFGWLAFWVSWLLAAVGAKPGRARWGQFVGFRIVVVVLIIALAHTSLLRHHRVHSWGLIAVGLALWALGLGLAVWARWHLGRNWGSPMSQKDNPELVTSGPYRWIRNPIYSGIILAMIGTAIAVDVAWIVVAVLLGSYFVYSAVTEQKYMAEQFPDSYPAYRSRTKMLIPFVF